MQVERPHDPNPSWSWLLASDLDGTLIPIERPDGYGHELTRFRLALHDNPIGMLAYVTGRDVPLAMEGILESKLPWPDIVVGDVGTSAVERVGEKEWVDIAEYDDRMSEALEGRDMIDLIAPLAAVDWLTPQEDAKQGPFKRSYYFPAELRADGVRADVQRRLDETGAPCGVVASHDPADGRGLLDVLPRGVDKASALAFIRERSGLPAHRVIYAGDSGNDTAAFLSGCHGVLVGNAALAVRNEIASEAARRGILDRIHFATEPLVSGVIEGCERFGFFAGETDAPDPASTP